MTLNLRELHFEILETQIHGTRKFGFLLPSVTWRTHSMVLGIFGPGQFGPGQLSPGQLGPRAQLSGAQLSTF